MEPNKRDDFKILLEIFDLPEDQVRLYNLIKRLGDTQESIENNLKAIKKDVKTIKRK